MDQPSPQRKNKKKRKGKNASGANSPLAQVSNTLLDEGLSRESSNGSLTLDPSSPSMLSSTPPSVDKNLLNEILGEIRDLKQRLPGSNSPTPPEEPATSNFLQHIESEKTRVRMEMEKKILEEENAKLKQKNSDLQDQFEYWKNRYNKLKDEIDERHHESDDNISHMYTRIGDLEAKVVSLEAERKSLYAELKNKDAQLDAWKEKYIDLQNSAEKRVDITKVTFERPEGEEEDEERPNGKEEKAENEVVKKEWEEVDNKDSEKVEERKDGGEDKEGDEKKEEKKEESGVKEIVNEVIEGAVKEAAESAQEGAAKEGETKGEKIEGEIKESPRGSQGSPRDSQESPRGPQESPREPQESPRGIEEGMEGGMISPRAQKMIDDVPKRRHRSRLEKAMASGKLENISTNTLDHQFAKAIQYSKSGNPLPNTPTTRMQELEAIADILKHDNEGEAPLSPPINNEPEGDDLMLNLNKITYHDGAMGRLPSTYSFGELDKVPSFAPLDEDDAKEKTPTPTPVGTLRASGDKKDRSETDAQAYERKVILAQSVVRRYQAKKRYKQIRKRAAIAREIFLTERTYVKHLHTCIKVFLRPLRQRAVVSEDGFIAIERLQTIFSTFEIIMKANYTFLKGLHTVIKLWNVESIVGPLLIDLLPLLEPHVDYIVNFEHAQTLLKEAIRESASFSMFLRASLSNPDLECKDMADFLIMPVQRIPRYVMLFQDLLKNTPQNHPDYSNLSTAVRLIKEFADMINDRKRSHYKIFQIKDGITGVKDVDLLHTGRFLVCEGDLKTRKGIEHYFLFNDLLLCCKAKKGGEKSEKSLTASPSMGSIPAEPDFGSNPYKFLAKLNIDTKTRVDDTKEAKNPLNIKLTLADHSIHIFTAASPEDKQRWLAGFNRAILHSPNPFTGPHAGYDISSTDLRYM